MTRTAAPLTQEVFEYSLAIVDVEPQQIHVPGPARALAVTWDTNRYNRSLKLFLLVERGGTDQMIARSFCVLATGQAFEKGTLSYIGSAVDAGGRDYHVFEVMG